jgi:hypothetical protein
VGDTVAESMRAPSRNTWMGSHVTEDASHTLPATSVHWPAVAKSSEPSMMTPLANVWRTSGLPDTPEAGIETCSR